MRKKLLLISLTAIMATPDCAFAKSKRLDIISLGDAQHSRMDAGVEAVDSNLEHGSVRILENEEKIGKRGQFSVLVFNASQSPANFGSENVSISVKGGDVAQVIPYERLLKEEKNRQMWAAIATGLSAASNNMAASQAGYSSGFASYSGSSYGRYGTVNSFGTATYSGYNGAAAYAAQSDANAQNQQMFDRLATSNAAGMEALRANLRTTTVDPGASYGGLITFELPKSARSSKKPVELIITVEFSGDQHVFSGAIAAN